MAGNSQRKGARRSPGSKKGPTVGSGGKGRAKLAGRGPTPPASARPHHPAARRATGQGRGTDDRADARDGRGDKRGDGRGDGRDGRGERRNESGGPRGSRRRSEELPELVVGRNPVVEALRARIPAIALYLVADADSDDRLSEAVKSAGDRGLPILEVSRPELDRLASGDSRRSVLHQGIGLQVPPYSYSHPDDLLERALKSAAGLLVAIDGLTDPRNLGAIVRSAAAFGADGIVIPERRSVGVTAAAWRTSAGAAARVPIARATNLVRTLASYQKAGLLIAGLTADGATNLDEFTGAVDPVCLVIGSEGRGMSRLVGETCDVHLSIPMAESTESLNASAAAAIALAEIARQRRIKA
jgi:23S rRNA (guanosine2251-2'-O)-methyltransferase